MNKCLFVFRETLLREDFKTILEVVCIQLIYLYIISLPCFSLLYNHIKDC